MAQKKKTAKRKSAPKALPLSPGSRPANQAKRWRNAARIPRIKVVRRLFVAGMRKPRFTDTIEYTDDYTGEDYTLTSGDPIDTGYTFEFPENSPTDSFTEEISIGYDDGTVTETWVDYECDSGSDEDQLIVDLIYLDEFIEYYEPDPCDAAYQMANSDGNFGIEG